MGRKKPQKNLAAAVGEAAVDHDSLVRSTTYCFFGRNSKLVIGPVFRTTDRIDKDLMKAVEGFKSFVSMIDDADGYVLPFEDERFGNTLTALASTVRTVLFFLSELDPHGEHCMSKTLDDPSWTFRFAGHSFYPIATAPCYPRESSRFNGGHKHTHIVFLAAAAFRRRHPVGQDRLPEGARVSIRDAYAKLGMDYDLRISLGPFECYKIVKPLRCGDAPVRWWEEGAVS